MTDDRHIDRYVRITNRERFLIVRALGLLESACETLGLAEDEEVWMLKRVFCEENWMSGHYIRHANKVLSVQAMEQDDDARGVIRFDPDTDEHK